MNQEPFRWDVSHSYALEHMLRRPVLKTKPIQPSSTYRSFQRSPDYGTDFSHISDSDLRFGDDLIRLCARIVAMGCQYDLVFVGRSLDSIFDYLSGLFRETSFRWRLGRLHVSLWGCRPERERQRLQAIRRYFKSQNLDPAGLRNRKRPVAFVDIVSSGSTFQSLIKLLMEWCAEEGVQWRPIASKLRFVALVQDCRSSCWDPAPRSRRPNCTRTDWCKGDSLIKALKGGSIKSIFVNWQLWGYLGNWQAKCADSYPPSQWGLEAAFRPSHNEERLRGLALAIYWHKEGLKRSSRRRFADLLCQEREMKHRALRDLVLQLKKRSARHD